MSIWKIGSIDKRLQFIIISASSGFPYIRTFRWSNTHSLQEIFSIIASAATGYDKLLISVIKISYLNSYSVNNSPLRSFCCVCESTVFGKQGMYAFDVIVTCDLHNWLFILGKYSPTLFRNYPFFSIML